VPYQGPRGPNFPIRIAEGIAVSWEFHKWRRQLKIDPIQAGAEKYEGAGKEQG
jgi:hypothetical protein